MSVRAVPIVLTICCLLTAGAAFAHKPSDSYLTLRVAGNAIEGQWDIALRDVDFVLGLDASQDGQITWGEVRTRHADIAAYALARLSIASDGNACEPRIADHLLDNHSDGAYAVLRFTAQCADAPNTLRVGYRLFFDVDPQHRGLLQLVNGDRVRTAIFSADRSEQRFELSQQKVLQQFADYLRHGARHIWMGFDHILFLLSLLLPAVLIRQSGAWEPTSRFTGAFWEVFKIVTAFTLAHSLTLTLAALEVVALPSRLVESAIATSVVLAAINNVFPLIGGRRWIIAFVFGLIHGFGFASVLADLGLPRETLLVALVAFNVGVEAGQLAVAGLFLPLAWRLRSTWFYRRVVLFAGSLAIVALASVWLIERAFNLKLLA